MDDYHFLVDSFLGMRDWNQVVASAKEIINKLLSRLRKS